MEVNQPLKEDQSVGIKPVTLSTTGALNTIASAGISSYSLQGSTTQTINGIVPGFSGQRMEFLNDAGQNATFTNLSGSAATGYQIDTGTGANFILQPGGVIQLTYSTHIGVWEMTASGAQGAQGTQGAQGSQGQFGGYSYGFFFNGATGGGSPGGNNLAFNSSTYSSITHMYVSTLEMNSVNVTAWLSSLGSSNPIIGDATVYSLGTPSTQIKFQITGFTVFSNYVDFAVTYVTSNGTFAGASTLILDLQDVGNKGATGSTGAQGAQGAQGSSAIGQTTSGGVTAGNIGEQISAQSAGVSVGSSGAFTNVASVTLNKGYWQISGTLVYDAGSTTAATIIAGGISSNSSSMDAVNTGAFIQLYGAMTLAPVNDAAYFSVGTRFIYISANSTTVYLLGQLTYSVLGGASWGVQSSINAVRVG